MRYAKNRRGSDRIEIRASALLIQEGLTLGHFMVQNLSASGALLTGTVDVFYRAPLQVVLQLPGGDSLSMGAEVIRRAQVGRIVALVVSFVHEDGTSEDRIQDALLELLDRTFRRSHPGVLVVEGSAAIRSDLVYRVQALGRRTVSVESPLGALQALQDPRECIDAVLVRQGRGATPGSELLEYIAESYPAVRPLLLVEDPCLDPMAPPAVQRCGPEHLAQALA